MAEYNLIQAPELVRRLQRRLGIRQAHISPTLNEGVQTVVVMDDLTNQKSETQRFALGRGVGNDSAGGNLSTVGLWNAAGSGKRVRVISIVTEQQTLTFPTLQNFALSNMGAAPVAGSAVVAGASRFEDTSLEPARPVANIIAGASLVVAGIVSTRPPRSAFLTTATVTVVSFDPYDLSREQLFLDPGWALTVQQQLNGGAAPQTLAATFTWYEEDLT